MAPRTSKPSRQHAASEAAGVAVRDPLPDVDPASVQRRAPFSANPRVGARGRRAQQRILEAALQVFGEVGYHPCGISRITQVAGCSRAAFYQYFSSKEDVFRQLAGQVARQLIASAESVDAITPDRAGWATLYAWTARHGAIYERYEPVFRVFRSAAESDELVAAGAARVGARDVSTLQAKLTATSLPDGHVSRVIALLLNVMAGARRLADVLRSVSPPGALDGERLDTTLTDVVHRALFGLDEAVNVHAAPAAPLPAAPRAATLLEDLRTDAAPKQASPSATRTLAMLLAAAHDVLVSRGYHGTRVDDITAAAGLSHGAFYQYFDNKDHLIRVLAARTLDELAAAFDGIPTIAGTPGPRSSAALRDWLHSYSAAYASRAAMLRVWVDATADDPILRHESAAALDWGRRRLTRFLRPRGFGDIDAEALIMVALLEALGAERDNQTTIDAAALAIERGLLGFDPTSTSG
jgi:AcrR family transcriptional regulator